jgi:thiol-disulfide isomerase/thioredoxin
MISRRGLLAGAGAVVAAGGALTLAIRTSTRHPAQDGTERAPDFSVAALDGRAHYQLADFSGKVLLLNFWATWCAPCRVEMPWLARTYARFRSEGFSILGVNMDDDDMPAVQRFVQEMGVTYPIARNNDAIVAAYGGVRFLPQSVLVGQQGQILRRSFGMPPTGEFEAAIMKALSKS